MDVDLMVTEEVVVDTSATGKRSKVMVTLSDDLVYTLNIEGESLSAVMDSIGADPDMKSEWQSWHRFVANPDQFLVYLYDPDFQQYVRYRTDTPIRHLARLKIKNKFYVQQSGHHPLLGTQSPLIADMIPADTEPTDTLATDLSADNPNTTGHELSAPAVSTAAVSPVLHNHSHDIITDSHHHNYHLNSPSAPTPAPTAHPITDEKPKATHLCGQTSKVTTKASKKLFVDAKFKAVGATNAGSETDSLSGDLLADAPTGPSFEDWTQEQTIALLDLCKAYAKELAPKKNVLEVEANVWQRLADELNTRDLGQPFDALMCRNHFSRLRLTYTNVLCYPSLKDETRWPYFDRMKRIIGDKPEEIQSKVKTRAQTRLKFRPKVVKPRPELRRQSVLNKRRPQTQTQTAAKKMVTSGGQSDTQTTANTAGVMKSVKTNHNGTGEVSELYVALLNLVKKYIKFFETEQKNSIWVRIEKELNSAGFTWTALSLRGLFHRLRYTYLNLVNDPKPQSNQWPYFRYFDGLDLTVFRQNKTSKSAAKDTNKGRGRPRKGRRGQSANVVQTARTSHPLANSENGSAERRPIGDHSKECSPDSSDAEAVENKRKAIETEL